MYIYIYIYIHIFTRCSWFWRIPEGSPRDPLGNSQRHPCTPSGWNPPRDLLGTPHAQPMYTLGNQWESIGYSIGYTIGYSIGYSWNMHTRWFLKHAYSVIPEACVLGNSWSMRARWFLKHACSVIPEACVLGDSWNLHTRWFLKIRYQVPGIRYRVSGIRYQVSGIWIHGFMDSWLHGFMALVL